ncbi:MAG: methyltransferase domain-containing protein, partial [Candidatus Eisenbacteria bacterium]|nr:methyltransferase domain-containing protein [Candidatus Eisenbacteria bacterium]
MRRSAGRPTDWYEESFDELYRLLYQHRDLEEASRALASIGERFDLRAGRVLDLGCGPGRYLRALATRGVRGFGLDLSLPLLREARRRLSATPLVRGDMRRLPFRDRSFRTVLLMFTTFGYFAERTDDERVLAEVARLLEPHGAFVLDYVNGRHVRENLVPRSGRLVRNLTVQETRWIDPSGPFLCKETTVSPVPRAGRNVYRERLRLYEPDELASMVEVAGFDLIGRKGVYRGEPFHARTSPRLLLFAVAREGQR